MKINCSGKAGIVSDAGLPTSGKTMPAASAQLDLRANSKRLVALAVAFALVTGCSVLPKPLEQEEVKSRVDQDMTRMYQEQAPISGPLTMEEAVARALRYNLDHALKHMESALAMDLSRYTNHDMLPELMATAGYRERSRYSGGTSIGIIDGNESNRPTSSDERRQTNHGVVFTWNVLDFGISYFRAKQQADEYLLAEERRRKVIHNIVQDVRSAYWRALAAQRLALESQRIMNRAELALERSREAERQRLVSPQVALIYQRALLDAIGLLKQRQQDLEFARAELAALMNVPAGVDFVLTEVAEADLPLPPVDVLRLEEFALLQRPELREEDLRRRMTAAEARKQMLGLLPGISFDFGAQYNSNRFEHHNSWTDGGVRLAWNLLRLPALPAQRAAQKQQVMTDDARRVALSMAIITQVRLAAERYRLALEDLKLADAGFAVDRRLADFSRAAAAARIESDLEAIRTELRAVLGAYQRANAYSEAQIALGRLQSSIGVDMIGSGMEQADLSELTQYVRDRMNQADSDAMSLFSELFGVVPVVAVRVSEAIDPVQRVNVSAMVNTVLSRYPLVQAAGAGAPNLSLTIETDTAGVWLLWQSEDGRVIERVLAPALEQTEAFMMRLDDTVVRAMDSVSFKSEVSGPHEG